jgi:hypothetical protein
VKVVGDFMAVFGVIHAEIHNHQNFVSRRSRIHGFCEAENNHSGAPRLDLRDNEFVLIDARRHALASSSRQMSQYRGCLIGQWLLDWAQLSLGSPLAPWATHLYSLSASKPRSLFLQRVERCLLLPFSVPCAIMRAVDAMHPIKRIPKS